MSQPTSYSRRLEQVLTYHERTKHHPHRNARSLGYMDWATQPNPFRVFRGAPIESLARDIPVGDVRFDDTYDPRRKPQSVSRQTISQLLFDSLALSAWKEFHGDKWSLRCNPSSGNLHPTECYLITPPAVGFGEAPTLFHYSPLFHALEKRSEFSKQDWLPFVQCLPNDTLFLAFTSIHWREAWKYGERSFRYCQHDVGHAIAAIAFASSALGWQTQLLEMTTDAHISQLTRTEEQSGPEAEHPDCLLAIIPTRATFTPERARQWRPDDAVLRRLAVQPLLGVPEPLSNQHHDWPVIAEVAEACTRASAPEEPSWNEDALSQDWSPTRPRRARRVFRQRRSATGFQRNTMIDSQMFYRMLTRVMPSDKLVPFAAIPSANLDLVLFVHRVVGISPGLYVLVRNPCHRVALEESLCGDFVWKRPPDCPPGLELFLLKEANCQELAKELSCHQDIAADGAFSVAMLAEFRPSLERWGAWFYRRLYWEAGMIGQVLYLEAEAAALRGTGIGCFFDDEVHRALGISDQHFQSIYHFTVGKPVEDSRLGVLDAYHHLSDSP